MNRQRWLIVPLAYTVLTRLRNRGAILDHLTRDVVIPLVPVIGVFGQDGVTALLLWLGFAALYEVGYLVNDEAPTSSEDGGDRLGGDSVSWGPAVMLRLLVWVAVAWWTISSAGWWVGMTYVVVSTLAVGLLLLHTFLSTHTPTIRFFSFSLLALFKYAPFLVPLIGWESAVPYLGSIFLMYGFPRSVHYALRKMSLTGSADEIRRFQLLSHGLGLIPAFVVVVPDLFLIHQRGWTAPALLWVLYVCAWVAALVARTTRIPNAIDGSKTRTPLM